jgi:hypothetical protein
MSYFLAPKQPSTEKTVANVHMAASVHTLESQRRARAAYTLIVVYYFNFKKGYLKKKQWF